MRESSETQSDRRQAPRTKLVEIAYIGMGPENGGLVLDVSDGGLSFHAVAPVTPSERINFLLSLRGHSRIEGAGEVVWTNELRTVCGLRFTSLSNGAREYLNHWTNQSRISTAAREKSVWPAPPALWSASARQEDSAVSIAGESNTSAEPFFAIPPAAEVYLSEPTGGTLWGVHLLLWIVLALLGATAMGSVFLFGVHVGRSRIDAERRSAAIPDAQVSQPVSAPASVPASSLASDAPSGTTESAADSSQATSYPTVERPAPTAATSIPSAAITDPNAALVNTSKTDDTPANSLQGPGDRGLSAKTPDPRVEQAFEAGKSDLAAALAYLRGTNGVRDSSKAAHLLWAAVANDNATAEVVLADLYLRGDGVAKSCEQGRVLLLAASKSGDPRAKAKLGELNTNGCQ